jgi:hypothetical protein
LAFGETFQGVSSDAPARDGENDLGWRHGYDTLRLDLNDSVSEADQPPQFFAIEPKSELSGVNAAAFAGFAFTKKCPYLAGRDA